MGAFKTSLTIKERCAIQPGGNHDTASHCVGPCRLASDRHHRDADASARSLGVGLGPRWPRLGPVPGCRANAAGVCVWLLPSLFVRVWLPSLFLRLRLSSVLLRLCLPSLLVWLWRLLWRIPALLPSCPVWRLSGRSPRCDSSRALALSQAVALRHG